MLRLLLVGGLCLGAVSSTSCGGLFCDQAGCDAVGAPAPAGDIQTGIAGAVAYQSDAGSEDCFECPLGNGSFQVWAAPGALTDKSDVVALLNAGPPEVRIDAAERYQQALEPGTYAVCSLFGDGGECVTVTVADGDVASVNGTSTLGGFRLLVFDPGSDSPRDDGRFELRADEVPELG